MWPGYLCFTRGLSPAELEAVGDAKAAQALPRSNAWYANGAEYNVPEFRIFNLTL